MVVDEAERELVRSGLAKRQRGEKLTTREQAAVRKFEAAQLEKTRDAIVHAIPKGLWCEWSGRQPKVVNEQADRYRLPLRGRTIDLPEFVRAFHDFLAANAKKLAGTDADDPLLAGASSAMLELYRGELLLGFIVDETPDFAAWLEAERAHLRGGALDAACRLAADQRAAGNIAGALHWLRRAATLAPWDETLLQERMQACAALGDGSGLVRYGLAVSLEVSPTLQVDIHEQVQSAIRTRVRPATRSRVSSR